VSEKSIETDERIDKELKPFVLEFQKEFRESVRLPVKLGPIDDRFAGVCETMYDGFRQITINEKAWGKLSHDQKEELVFHELLHCVYDLSHIEGHYPKSGCPLSIMNPKLFTIYQGQACYNRYKDYYIGQIKVALNK
jgi:predicted metal-dependent peptidase